MASKNELEVSNLSFINRDFASIYPDLLDLVKTLTNRWDPTTSNESDPGVVLLKLAAFVADHLNYNIDKNILEAFLPTATQDESVRRIAEFGGYTPKYFKSAIGDVSITYKGETTGFSIPKFSLVISNEDGSITYTQLNDASISAKNTPVTCTFIEGTVQQLALNTDKVITLANLDSNNRLYFPNKFVAENGVFIYNKSGNTGEAWKKTPYISTQPIGTKCYKIDYSSEKGLPYIEFPSDVANLMADGLYIWYISTSGSYGNVSANALNKVVSINNTSAMDAQNITADNFVVSNVSSISNGVEPESIDDIYQSYKKVVGTFDTLVTCNDYSNAIRMLENEDGTKYVSNGVVADRRIDYNDAANIVSYDQYGIYTKNVSLNVGKLKFEFGTGTIPPLGSSVGTVWISTTDKKIYIYTKDKKWVEIKSLDQSELREYLDGMNPYDLIIYGLKAYSSNEYNSVFYWKALENSFKQIDGDTDLSNGIGTEDEIISALGDLKCINHTFRDLNTGDVYCFKNKVPLKVDIIPYNKVSKYERDEILDNVRRAISENFNASKLEFGIELNYDKVVEVIKNADNRINNIRLADFNYQTFVMLKNDQNNPEDKELSIFDPIEDGDGTTYLVDLVSKNVLAGRVCLFNFDKQFIYTYGQTETTLYNDISGLSTYGLVSGIETSEYVSFEDTSIPNNTYVEILYPNFYSKETYGSYVYYRYTPGVHDYIPKNTEFELAAGDKIDLKYTADGIEKTTTITAGTIVKTSFDLRAEMPNKHADDEGFYQMASNDSISTRVLLETILDTPTYCYWVTNNTGNTLFDEDTPTDALGNYLKLLGDGEYFVYTDSTKENLVVFGRGTLISLPHSVASSSLTPDDFILTTSNKVSYSALSENGIASKLPYAYIDLSRGNLSLIEMNIITLGAGDTFTCKVNNNQWTNTEDFTAISVWDDQSVTVPLKNKLNNNLKYTMGDDISYTINGEETILTGQDNFYQIRSRLDLICSPTSAQELLDDQLVVITDSKYPVEGRVLWSRDIDSRLFIQPNLPVDLIGGANINISNYSNLGLELDALSYCQENLKLNSDKLVPYDYDFYIGYYGPYYSRITKTEVAKPTSTDPDIIQQFIDTTYVLSSAQGIAPEQQSISFNTGEFSITLDEKGEIELPFSFFNIFDSEGYTSEGSEGDQSISDREYISTIYLLGNDNLQVMASYYFNNSGQRIPIGWYGNHGEIIDGDTSEGVWKMALKAGDANFIYPNLWYNEGETVVLKLEWDVPPVVEDGLPYLLNIKDIKVSNGVNPELASNKEALVNRIEKLLKSSDNEDLQFYYINEPDKNMVINYNDLSDPYSLFDHNNVANIFTIPEIDLYNSDIDIIKSMRDYKW